MRRIAVVTDDVDMARTVCQRLLNHCMGNGAYYEFLPLSRWEDVPPECTGCVVGGASVLETVAALRGRGGQYLIVALSREKETCVGCYEYQRVYCAAEDDWETVLSRLNK